MGDLSPSFSRAEFSCPCAKCETVVAMGLVDRLQRIRDAIRMPIRITSGYRCKTYNAQVGGETDSAHLTGEAVDVLMPSNEYRAIFIEQMVRWFSRYGIYDRHIHMDISTTMPSPRCWVGVSK